MVTANAMFVIRISQGVDHGMLIFLEVIWAGATSYFKNEIEILL